MAGVGRTLKLPLLVAKADGLARGLPANGAVRVRPPIHAPPAIHAHGTAAVIPARRRRPLAGGCTVHRDGAIIARD
jgi:hypothetical protein